MWQRTYEFGVPCDLSVTSLCCHRHWQTGWARVIGLVKSMRTCEIMDSHRLRVDSAKRTKKDTLERGF